MTEKKDFPRDDEIRSAFQRQASRISSHLDVESSLADIEGREPDSVEPTPRKARRRPKSGSLVIARGPLVALASGLVVVLLVGMAGILATDWLSPDGTIEVTGTTLGSDPETLVTGESIVDPPPTSGWDDPRYGIVDSDGSGAVVLFAEPDPMGTVIAELVPPRVVTLTGERRVVGEITFYQVKIDGGDGWIAATELTRPEVWDSGLEAVPCSQDDGEFFKDRVVVGEAMGTSSGSPAGHFLDAFRFTSEGCERIVIVLGEGEGLDGDGVWSGVPAGVVPSGATVEVDGSMVSLLVPGVDAVRPLAATLELDGVLGIATRTPEGMALRLFFGVGQQVAVHVLGNPARVVIDLRPDPDSATQDLAARRGGEFVVLPVATDSSTQVSVVGWGRPNEASAIAELRERADQPGGGELVEATFSSAPSGTETTSRYVFATTDWALWGSFAFTIDDLAPGEYEVFIGENTPSEGNPGVYLLFTVGG